jgi:hypothetical protein
MERRRGSRGPSTANPLLASAGLDRLTHRAHMIVTTGTSFRAHASTQPQEKVPIDTTP